MAKKKVLIRPPRYVDKPEVDLVSCERELRRYVKRSGGFRKGISRTDKKRAQKMLKLLGRIGLEWDKNIIPTT